MNPVECCDEYCTSCRICYLKLLRPGDTVPFKPPKYVLPLGGIECLLSIVIIILDVLAIYSQSNGLTSPAPSFLGSPGIPIWLTIVTAIAFGFSSLGTLLVVVLLAVLTLAVAEEQKHSSPTGLVISIIICFISIILLFVTSLSTLSTYLALTSHDDRWFTDRGTQHEPTAHSSGENSNTRAQLSVPSGQPAFFFYAPSKEAFDYSNAFQNVINNMEPTCSGQKAHANNNNAYQKDVIDDRKTEELLSEDEGSTVTTVPPNVVRKTPENYSKASGFKGETS